ncbi:sucrose-6-phosphate hydrolase [Mesobacillus maritimus]|uniref:glycoside hydrolase family 32 protein n=1 Tax=Mesobacillus maritimus TaxID=1643336 RepID=UPI0020414F39|nr:sucrose-6-phosphate hydrolase [Mesobacillus maritimus]MCM3586565.1 sucrose-6-phosphate hydrolase [Mesobacillus maritimus]MCM3668681.1 sucrose-6-phosphate hydrolase [Mesobacillus maritimus]
MTQQELLAKAAKKVTENQNKIEKDSNRLQFHLMPPVGLLNDPNGLIHFNGVYHVFYQWNPFETAHGAKFWGHYTSYDLVNWQEQPPALAPSEWYEKNGCYSGSAVEADGKLILFYTGNVKNENNERETYQCMAVSTDGIHFEKKGPVVYLPEGYTAHFRDPKVWKQNGIWYMVLGAQTESEDGQVVLYESNDLENWKFKGPIAGGNLNGLGKFGYMWECPDLFRLSGKDVLLISPQGIEAEKHRYQNLFQSGYFVGNWNSEKNVYEHGAFVELDHGFDFYAPQTFEDAQGRRIMYAWMGLTDEHEAYQPTIKNGWIHGLTLPRELALKGNKLYQKPVEELKQLRKSTDFNGQVSLENEKWSDLTGSISELAIDIQQLNVKMLSITIRDNLKLIYHQDQGLLNLERKTFKDGTPETRSCELASLRKLHIFIDTSSVEVFLNDGEEVMTARFFADPAEQKISVSANGQVEMFIEKWSLQAFPK